MADNICRAITFINFHIPLRWDSDVSAQYSTIGFFDGLYTKRIELNYQEDDLKPLWQYTNHKTAENKGYYSYQNIFGFSKDNWNSIRDEVFWDTSTDEDFPLTFVVFLQVKDYMTGEHTIEAQCRNFCRVINDNLSGIGRSYTYSTIDKNDFIVCIKSKKYEQTVTAIKQLHNAGVDVVYSYTIFSVNKSVLDKLNEEKYSYLFAENIPSICLKGIANSYGAGQGISLDRKYRKFCNILLNRLYGETDSDKQVEEDENKVAYDILGDNDFRFIARDVSLGRILREYAPGGILCYTKREFPYYLFSSSLVLNTRTGGKEKIDDDEITVAITAMQKEFTCKMCDELSQQMQGIIDIVNERSSVREECVTTFCQAIFQLLQSLKVLETAPTKKYDFYSLYLPLETFIHILEEKLTDTNIGNNKMIYEFIHKISMTLHGTLRTDIQFFQIRDFNVIVHYAPAKIRAFYALWAMRIKEFYEKFGFDEDVPQHEYSFILAPGMYKGTAVRQLFEDSRETRHLMLITLPERHIYSPRWITVILAHEVSHFVGSAVRNREERHKTWLGVFSRILGLELQAFMYKRFSEITSTGVISACRENICLFEQIQEQWLRTEEKIRMDDRWENENNKYHSKQSIQIIMESYRKFLKEYIEQIIKDFVSDVRYFICGSRKKYSVKETDDMIRRKCNAVIEDMMALCNSINELVIESTLDLIKTVTAEIFADIMAILTLELSPTDYVRSFVKTELKKGEGNLGTNRTVTFIDIRIAIVAETLYKVFEDRPDSKALFRNYDSWITKPVENLKDLSDAKEDEKKIANTVCEFLKSWGNLASRINTYNPIATEDGFRGRNSDYLRDEKVIGLICDYLKNCADIYIDKLSHTEDVADRREELLKTYRNISGNSEMELMVEIESFLSKAEETYAHKNT